MFTIYFCYLVVMDIFKMRIGCRPTGKVATSHLLSILVKTTQANPRSANSLKVSSTRMSTHLELFAYRSSMRIVGGDQQLQLSKFLRVFRICWINPTLMILHKRKDITSSFRIMWSTRKESGSRLSNTHQLSNAKD